MNAVSKEKKTIPTHKNFEYRLLLELRNSDAKKTIESK